MAKTKCSLKDVIKISTLLTSQVRVSVLEGPVGLSRRKYFHFWHLLKLTFTFTKYLLHWHYLDTTASCTQTPQGTNGDIAFIERTSVYLSVVLDWNPLLYSAQLFLSSEQLFTRHYHQIGRSSVLLLISWNRGNISVRCSFTFYWQTGMPSSVFQPSAGIPWLV